MIDLILYGIPSILITYIYWCLRKTCFKCFSWNSLEKFNEDFSHYSKRSSGGYDEKFRITYVCKKCQKPTTRIKYKYQYTAEAIGVFFAAIMILSGSVKQLNSHSESKSTSNYESNNENVNDNSSSSHSSVTYDLSKKSQQHKTIPKNNNTSTNHSFTNKDTSTKSKEFESSNVAETEVTSDENTKRAIDMLKRDKSIGEIMDSTKLSRKEIRQLKRQLKNE